MTLNEIEGHSSVSGLFKGKSSTFVQRSNLQDFNWHARVAWSLSDSWASCCTLHACLSKCLYLRLQNEILGEVCPPNGKQYQPDPQDAYPCVIAFRMTQTSTLHDISFRRYRFQLTRPCRTVPQRQLGFLLSSSINLPDRLAVTFKFQNS